jgi:hypothetical protein
VRRLSTPSPEFKKIGPVSGVPGGRSFISNQTGWRLSTVALLAATPVVKDSIADRNAFATDIDEVVDWREKLIIPK